MDQMFDSRYPAPTAHANIPSIIFIIGLFLFVAAPVHYAIIGDAANSMILTAYSFFFFLASGLLRLCDSGDVD